MVSKNRLGGDEVDKLGGMGCDGMGGESMKRGAPAMQKRPMSVSVLVTYIVILYLC